MTYGNLIFSPNDRWLMAGPGWQTWDLTTGQQVVAPGKAGRGNWVALSPDAKRLVFIDGDGIVSFWGLAQAGDLSRRTLISSQRFHRDNGRSVAYSPDGRLVASAAENIILWDAITQQLILRWEHAAIVWSVAFSPDGRWLVSTHGDGAILLWDVVERRRVASFSEHSDAVRAVAFSRSGKRIASAGEDRSVIIWDAASGRKEAVLDGHQSRITGISFSPDESWAASCEQDGYAIVWDIARRQPRWKSILPEANNNCLAISPDGRWVATTLGVYESTDGRQVVAFYVSDPQKSIHGLYGIAFSRDGRRLVCVTARGQIRVWDTQQWEIVERLDLSHASLISASFSPDGQWLVTGQDEGAVRLWQVRPLREVAQLGRHAARIK